MKYRLLILRVMSATLIALGFTTSASAGDRSALEEALKAKYELTKTGLDRVRITQPGTVLVIQKEGISGDLSSDMTFLNNKIRDGHVAQAGGFDLPRFSHPCRSEDLNVSANSLGVR